MKHRLLLILLVFLLTNCYSQNNKIDSIIAAAKVDYPETGIVVGILNDGKNSYYRSGNRYKDGSTQLDSLTIFEIGSATKTFTGMLLAKEIVKGHFSLDDFFDSYLPDSIKLPSNLQEKIRLTDLVSHQSGLPNLSNDEYFAELFNRDAENPFRFVDEKYLFSILERTDTLAGYRSYQYNNYAFSLIGLIIEEIYDQDYETLIGDEILKPLGMSSTTFEITIIDQNRAGLYNQSGEVQDDIILSDVNPAGGLRSNAVDLLRYLKAHLQDSEIREEVKLTQLTYYQDVTKRIGLGWEISDEYYQKDGDTFGNSTLIRYSPKYDIAIVVLSNHQNGQLVRDVMNGIYDYIIK
ncbi:MAG: serine hydrolase domain-containing protein [Maribacter sp.]